MLYILNIFMFIVSLTQQMPHALPDHFEEKEFIVEINKELTAPLYSTLSAVKEQFIIKTFEAKFENNRLYFDNVKLYPNVDFYELVISYKGVNYVEKIPFNSVKSGKYLGKVYELGNKKDNLNIEQMDIIVDFDSQRDLFVVTNDIMIQNSGDFTYSPNIPQDNEGFFIQLPNGFSDVTPQFNLSESSIKTIENGVVLNIFVKPGKNFYTFNYYLKVDSVFKTSFPLSINKLRLIVPNLKITVKEDENIQFFIRETENGTVKIATLGSLDKNKEFSFEASKPILKSRDISISKSQMKLFKKPVYIFFMGGFLLLLSFIVIT
ncbi:hypothetical protein JXR93_03335, partial [bacterium]|nr:hypothetical protein [bacterium]